jgi:tagatose-1,6-bisphosphate aldolase non-catalytic subunit AgaZ/GatZ
MPPFAYAQGTQKFSAWPPSLPEIVSFLLQRFDEYGWAPTLLGVGPMSETAVRAGIEVARDRDCPIMFIASRNQVDAREFGGGYAEGWDQGGFVEAVRRNAREASFDGLVFVCRDHGGPWHKDEEWAARLGPQEAMERAKRSYAADLEAGFDLLHIDPTKDPGMPAPLPMELVRERTVELISASQAEAARLGLRHVGYEVGTEETSGGLTEPSVLEGFVRSLCEQLQAAGLPRPIFMVGQTGTLIRMRSNIGRFDGDHAKRLAALLRGLGFGLKEHNADYLPDEILAQHCELGITAANVAPEIAHAETAALLDLAGREEPSGVQDGFAQVLEKQALESGRWRKWLGPSEQKVGEEALLSDAAMRRRLVEVSGHYTFHLENVRQARARLYENLKNAGLSADPHREVLEAVKGSIEHYVEALGLEGLTSELRSLAPGARP